MRRRAVITPSSAPSSASMLSHRGAMNRIQSRPSICSNREILSLPRGVQKSLSRAFSSDSAGAPTKPPSSPPSSTSSSSSPASTTQSDTSRLNLRVGRIVEVAKHAGADNLYVTKVDIGEPTQRQIVAGLVKHIPSDELLNRFVVVLANLQARAFRGVPSEGMLLVAADATKTKLETIEPPAGVGAGERVTVSGDKGEFERPHLNKKVLDRVLPFLKVNDKGEANYKGNALVTSKGPVIARTLKNAQIS